VVEKMDPFEQELREQLQARSAPGGFADRVMARVPQRRAPRETFLGFGLGFRQPVWRWAVAAVLVAGMVLGGLEHDHQQRMAGERAREQVLLALRITGSTLRDVQQKVSARDERESFSQKGTVRDKDEQ
jgi:anti-sigma factor RsiW